MSPINPEVNGIKRFSKHRLIGIIISPSLETYDFSHINKAHHEGIPVIQFDRVDDKIDLPSVSIDDEKAGYIATKHLIESGYEQYKLYFH